MVDATGTTQAACYASTSPAEISCVEPGSTTTAAAPMVPGMKATALRPDHRREILEPEKKGYAQMEVISDIPVESESPIALTIGKFDGVHLGHRAVVERLKQNAAARQLPACALTFDPHPIEYFLGARAPVRLTSLRDKIRLLEETQALDRLYVFPFTEAIAGMSPKSFVANVLVGQLAVRSLLVGKDFHFGAERGGDITTLRTLGCEVGLEVATLEDFFLDGVRVSSTAIRAAVAEGDVSRVRRFLGRG